MYVIIFIFFINNIFNSLKDLPQLIFLFSCTFISHFNTTYYHSIIF